MKKNNALTSGVLMLSASWIAKTLGLLSTIILARLLTPEDFGLVAITMLVIHFLAVFAQTGAQQYLLSKESVDNDDLNTTWSLTMLLRVFICLVLFLLAEPIANYFQAEISNMLRVSSLILIIIGLNNPAVSLLKRKFNYSKIFKLALLAKFISFTVTISIAYYTHSYWALIIGTICHYSVSTIGSYFISPFKPKFCLKRFEQQWQFSKWILLRGFTGYIRSKGDAFIIAKAFSTSEVGLFTIAKEFAMLVYDQIAIPLADIILISVQKAKKEQKNIAEIVEKYLLVLMCLILPVICLLSLLSESIVVVILGEQWLPAAPILSILTLLGVSASITVVFTSTLTALKQTKLTFKIDVVTTVIILTSLYLLSNLDIVDFALARALLDSCVLISYLFFTKLAIGLSLRSTLKNLAPILLSGAIMALVVVQFTTMFAVDSFIMLCLVSLLSGLCYLISLLVLVNIFPYASNTLIELRLLINTSLKQAYRKLTFSNK